MKLKIFEVAELNNNNNATILDIEKDKYKAFITDKKGNDLGIEYITEDQIKKL